MVNGPFNLAVGLSGIVASGCLGYWLAGGKGAAVGAFIGAAYVFFYALLAFSGRLEEGPTSASP
jgi:hypothetical protein